MENKIYYFSLIPLIFFKVISVYYTDFSIYGDEAQYWFWSKSPDFGYFSKPPLLAWFLSGHIFVFGDSYFSLKMFPLLVYFFIGFAIYNLCLQLSLSKKVSGFCAISFLLIPAASLSSFLISTDLLLLLFWILSLTQLLHIRERGLLINFFLLGLFLGLAFIAKYAAVYFFFSLFFLLVVDKNTTLSFRKNLFGCLVFFISFLIVILPNIFWNIQNSWVTFSHTSDNANLKNLNLNFYEPLKFLVSQILMLGPVLFLSFVLFAKYLVFEFRNKFLLTFSLPIILIVLIESFLVRANANWAAPALISLFILVFVLVFQKKMVLIKVNFVFNYLVALILFGLILTSSNNSFFDRIRGVGVFVEQILIETEGKDLVISDRIILSNVAYELRGKKLNIYTPHKKGSRITNHFQIAVPLSEKHQNDFFLIGELDSVSYLLKNYQGKLIRDFFVPFNSSRLRLYEVSFK